MSSILGAKADGMRPPYSERKGGRGGSGPVRFGAETLCPAPGPAGPCDCEVLALLSHVGSVGLGRASSCSSPRSPGLGEVGAARPSPAWAPDPGRAWGETGPEPQWKLSAGPGAHSPTGAGLGPKGPSASRWPGRAESSERGETWGQVGAPGCAHPRQRSGFRARGPGQGGRGCGRRPGGSCCSCFSGRGPPGSLSRQRLDLHQ